jgi:hypothetical protein
MSRGNNDTYKLGSRGRSTCVIHLGDTFTVVASVGDRF